MIRWAFKNRPVEVIEARLSDTMLHETEKLMESPYRRCIWQSELCCAVRQETFELVRRGTPP